VALLQVTGKALPGSGIPDRKRASEVGVFMVRLLQRRGFAS